MQHRGSIGVVGSTGAPINGSVMANTRMSESLLLHVSQPAELLFDGLSACYSAGEMLRHRSAERQ